LTPAELLQQLIRFDTTNPPGNESECIGFVRNLLEDAGCETQTYAKDTDRPNLVARLQGARARARRFCCRATSTSSRPAAGRAARS
jgi:acetylornithine deacetylase/succinyl-diaminopimelate desuccinylase-like protein